MTTRITGLALAALLLLGIQTAVFAGPGCSKPCQGASLGLGCGGHGAKAEAATSPTEEAAATVKKGGCPHGGSGQAAATGHAGSAHAVMTAEGLNYVNTAETLYTCPMHAEVVTADGKKKCPSCNMNLRAMSDEEMLTLRASEPKGCSMCDFVVPGDSEQKTCPRCEMKLVPVPAGHHHPTGGM